MIYSISLKVSVWRMIEQVFGSLTREKAEELVGMSPSLGTFSTL